MELFLYGTKKPQAEKTAYNRAESTPKSKYRGHKAGNEQPK